MINSFKKSLFLLVILFNCGSPIEPWDNGIIPYYVDNSIDEQTKYYLNLSIDYIKDKTNVRMVEMGEKGDYICVISQKNKMDHSASIGFVKKSHIELGNDAGPKEIIHEIVHVMGFWHEHQRPDRDKYVKILWENIEKGKKHNFDKKEDYLYPIKIFEYDYQSIMHYEPLAYSKNGKKTIKMGNIEIIPSLSELDIVKINWVYPDWR